MADTAQQGAVDDLNSALKEALAGSRETSNWRDPVNGSLHPVIERGGKRVFVQDPEALQQEQAALQAAARAAMTDQQKKR